MSQQVASIYADLKVKTNNAQAELKNFKRGVDSTGDALSLAAQKTAILGTVVTATTGLIVSSYKEYSKLTETVRDLSLVSGESTESTSRFIAVLDDFQLTAEDATTAARFLKEKGLSPNIETLAMLADEFKKIEDPAERLIFMQENLGKGGAKWANILSQESSELRKLAAATKAGLVVSEQQVKMYEVQRLALDNLNDGIQAQKVTLGENTANVVAYVIAYERAIRIMKERGQALTFNINAEEQFNDAMEEAMAEQLRAADASIINTESLKDLELATIAAEEATRELSNANQVFLGVIGDVQNVEENFAEQYKRISEDMSLSDDERIAKINEVKQEYEIAKLEIISGLAERKLMEDGTLTDDEVNWLINKREEWGIYSADVAQKARDMMAEVNNLTATIANVPTDKTITFNMVTNGAPPNLSMSNSQAPVGTRRHATGGEFIIPPSYGDEGFKLGNGDTASAGEGINIIPKGQSNSNNNADILAALKRLPREITSAIMAAG